MTFSSILKIRVHPEQRADAIQAFKDRRILEECGEAIPGFHHGDLWLSQEDPDVFMVMVYWESRAAWEMWRNHPVRLAQESDLSALLAEPPMGQLFELVDEK